jgi:class 3 adenylate cyclase
VKWLGDGVMFYFRAPGAAALAAVEMVEAVGRHGLPPAHVGIHAGPVAFTEIGPVQLKGVAGTLRLSTARRTA